MNATLTAGAFYLIAMIAADVLLSAINVMPEQFPAVVLWPFRVGSFGAQFLMWTEFGLTSEPLAERLFAPRVVGLPGRPAVA